MIDIIFSPWMLLLALVLGTIGLLLIWFSLPHLALWLKMLRNWQRRTNHKEIAQQEEEIQLQHHELQHHAKHVDVERMQSKDQQIIEQEQEAVKIVGVMEKPGRDMPWTRKVWEEKIAPMLHLDQGMDTSNAKGFWTALLHLQASQEKGPTYWQKLVGGSKGGRGKGGGAGRF